jgi:hypothetical protein
MCTRTCVDLSLVQMCEVRRKAARVRQAVASASTDAGVAHLLRECAMLFPYVPPPVLPDRPSQCAADVADALYKCYDPRRVRQLCPAARQVDASVAVVLMSSLGSRFMPLPPLEGSSVKCYGMLKGYALRKVDEMPRRLVFDRLTRKVLKLLPSIRCSALRNAARSMDLPTEHALAVYTDLVKYCGTCRPVLALLHVLRELAFWPYLSCHC